MKNMSLIKKIILAELAVLILVYIIVASITPMVVYSLVSKPEAQDAMSFNKQVAMSMEQRFEELKRFSSVVAEDDGLNELLRIGISDKSSSNDAKLRMYLSNIIQKDGVSTYHVLGMYLEVDNPEKYATTTVGLSDNLKSYIQDQVMPEYIADDRDSDFIEPFVFSTDDNKSSWFGNAFTRGYGYITRYNKNGVTGRLVIISSYDEIVYIVNNLSSYSNDYVLLTRDRHAVIPSIEDSEIDYIEILDNCKFGDSYLEGYYIRKDGIFTSRTIQVGGWTLLTYISKEEVLKRNTTQSYMILISVGLFGIITISATILVLRKFIAPLKEVSGQMEIIAGGNFGVRVPIESGDEIGQVGVSFNIMASKLEEMIGEIIEKEKIEQRMRYSLLVSQIDPHFIYNTMNTITYLAQKGRNEDVIIVNKAMIEILRDRLRIEISEVYDTVQQELNVVEKYLIIQKYRFNGMFKVKTQIEDGVRECLIAKNILQPLVENALAHGIMENKDENGELLGGCITLTIKKNREYLFLEIADNGTGMSQERIQEILNDEGKRARGEHIGIRNIKERIKYIYENKAEITIWSEIEMGTKVMLKLPVNVEEGKNGNTRVGELCDTRMDLLTQNR